MNTLQRLGLILGIISFTIPLIFNFPCLSFPGHLALAIFLLAIFLLAAFFWMFEPIPIYATSLVVVFLGVVLLSKQGLIFNTLTAEQALSQYNFKLGSAANYVATLADPIIILFLGGFMIADAAVKYDFDKNITRVMMKPFGEKPHFIMLGLMLVTGVLSAFMSNTATTAMMMTVILPFMASMEKSDKFRIALALCIPFAASIGGLATPIGSPPNAIVVAAAARAGFSISFAQWVILVAPLALIMLVITWGLLYFLYRPKVKNIKINQNSQWVHSRKAWIFYLVFALTVIIWMSESLHGVSSNFVALIPITFLCVFEVIEVEDLRKLPWEVLWLVSGGIALGVYMSDTKLSNWLVSQINWSSMSSIYILAMFGIVGVSISNFMSNTVAATLLVPLAISIGVSQSTTTGAMNQTTLALIAGIGTSLAMVLPISTPPNAIAMATGIIKTGDMAKAGAIIGIIGVVLALILSLVYWPLLIK